MQKIRNNFEAAGFDVGSDDVHFHHVCYADSPRHAVINYNGDVQHVILQQRVGKDD